MKRCTTCGEPMTRWPTFHNCGRVEISKDRLRVLEEHEAVLVRIRDRYLGHSSRTIAMIAGWADESLTGPLEGKGPSA